MRDMVVRYVSIHIINQNSRNCAGTALAGELGWHSLVSLWCGSVMFTLYTQTVLNHASIVVKSSANRLLRI